MTQANEPQQDDSALEYTDGRRKLSAHGSAAMKALSVIALAAALAAAVYFLAGCATLGGASIGQTQTGAAVDISAVAFPVLCTAVCAVGCKEINWTCVSECAIACLGIEVPTGGPHADEAVDASPGGPLHGRLPDGGPSLDGSSLTRD